MDYQEPLIKIADLATRLYLTKTDHRLFFHNLAHTIRLVESTRQWSAHYQLDSRNHFVVSVSAWLYDLEMMNTGTKNREIVHTTTVEEFP